MRDLLLIPALAALLGGMAVPAMAADTGRSDAPRVIQVDHDDDDDDRVRGHYGRDEADDDGDDRERVYGYRADDDDVDDDDDEDRYERRHDYESDHRT